MVSAMMKLTLQAATLMVGTAVDSALTQSTVLTVNVRERTMVLSTHFLLMAFVRMKQTMETVCLMALIVVDMMTIMMVIMMITHHHGLTLNLGVICPFVLSVFVMVCIFQSIFPVYLKCIEMN